MPQRLRAVALVLLGLVVSIAASTARAEQGPIDHTKAAGKELGQAVKKGAKKVKPALKDAGKALKKAAGDAKKALKE